MTGARTQGAQAQSGGKAVATSLEVNEGPGGKDSKREHISPNGNEGMLYKSVAGKGKPTMEDEATSCGDPLPPLNLKGARGRGTTRTQSR